MTVHELKTWPEYYAAVRSGKKTFEYRENDRDYKVGDYLVLQEFEPSNHSYTGRSLYAEVTYILDLSSSGGYVILAIKRRANDSKGPVS